MFLQKIDEAEFDDPEFDYVVEIKGGEKICFGSTVERCTDPIGKGLSPLQKRTAAETFPKIGPGCYHPEDVKSAMADELYKIRSRAGVPPLASKSARFESHDRRQVRTPSPGRYQTTNYWVAQKKSAVPFGVGGRARGGQESDVPGPMTYDIRKVRKCRRSKKMNNFGRPVMIPCVEVVCVSTPTDACQRCGRLCGGDYWHRRHDAFLCQACWREARPRAAVADFRKMRNCSFMHNHEGTDAAERIMPAARIAKKVALENYLEEYMGGKC